ncbi:hypothetical protein ENBRE01_2027 [Enteropsectra breve]|nr:hypothetical protein ENBRE01_2027 [Enteropsectra breve]
METETAAGDILLAERNETREVMGNSLYSNENTTVCSDTSKKLDFSKRSQINCNKRLYYSVIKHGRIFKYIRMRYMKHHSANTTSKPENSYDDDVICRICYSNTNPFTDASDLISPCKCKGSVKYVHSTCLKIWRYKRGFLQNTKKCETCQATYSLMSCSLKYRIFISSATVAISLLIYSLFYLFFTTFIRSCIIVANDVIYSLPSHFEHYSCLLLFLALFKLYCKPSFLVLFNYIFTYWRLIQFCYRVDQILFLVFSAHLLKELSEQLYSLLDHTYFYLAESQQYFKDMQ